MKLDDCCKMSIIHTAAFCAKIADDHKGNLQIGDIIRSYFKLPDNKEEKDEAG